MLTAGSLTKSKRSLTPSQGWDVEFRSKHLLPDPFIFGRPTPCHSEMFLVKLVVVIRVIVDDHEQDRDFVTDCGPNRSYAHEEVTIAADRNRQPP